jgi:hypothetical protein
MDAIYRVNGNRVVTSVNAAGPCRLLAENVVMVGATVLKIRMQALNLPSDVRDQPVGLPGPDQARTEQPDFFQQSICSGRLDARLRLVIERR